MLFSLSLIVFSPFMALLPTFYLIYWFVKKGSSESIRNWSIGLFLLFLWSIFAGLINWQVYSVIAAGAFLLFFFLSIYIEQNLHTEELAEKVFFSAFVLSAGSAFLGLLEYSDLITRDPVWWKYFFGLTTLIENRDTLYRITGTFGNSNYAAAWYAVMVLVGLYFADQTKGLKKLLIESATVLFIAVLIMTQSRGAMFGLFLGLLIYDLTGRKRRIFMIRAAVLLLGLAFILLFPHVFPRGGVLFSTIDLRQAIWSNCFNMFLIKPVAGWGIMGIYLADSNVYQYLRVLHAHNNILSIITMLGIVGLTIFVWMEYGIIRDLIYLYRDRCRLVPLLAGIQLIFIGHGIFDFAIMSPQIGLLFFGTSAFIGSLCWGERKIYEQ